MNAKTARERLSPGRSMIGVACACVLLATSLVLAGCGGGSSGTDTTASATAEQPTATTEQAATTESMDSMDGSELADAIFSTWEEAMQKLNTLLADRPDPASVQTQVEQLKEEYIQKLVALGHQVAALDLGEKATMQAELLSAAMDASEEDWYASYSDIYVEYAGSDIEFSKLVADFNILTQYADFDLLKQQEPEEDQQRYLQSAKAHVGVDERAAGSHRIAGTVFEDGIREDVREQYDPQQREPEPRAGIRRQNHVRLPDRYHRPYQAGPELRGKPNDCVPGTLHGRPRSRSLKRSLLSPAGCPAVAAEQIEGYISILSCRMIFKRARPEPAARRQRTV